MDTASYVIAEMNSYLTNKHQRVKVNSGYSLWKLIKYGVHKNQFYIMYYSVYFYVICIYDVDVASYTDGNTPYTRENFQIRFRKNFNVHLEIYLNGSLVTQ